jgi:hypothetical protein
VMPTALHSTAGDSGRVAFGFRRGPTRCGTIQVSWEIGRRLLAAKPPDLAAPSLPHPPLARLA